MIELTDIHASKLRFVFGSILIIASLMLLSFMISAIKTNDKVLASDTITNLAGDKASDANVVSTGLAHMFNSTFEAIDSMEHSLVSGYRSITSAITQAAKPIGTAAIQGGKATARYTYKGMTSVAKGIGNGLVYVVLSPIKVLGYTADKLSDNPIARPSHNSEVPVIDTQLAALYAQSPETKNEKLVNPSEILSDSQTIWPIRGRITTKFGVPHWPYQETHTGLDISSDHSSGVMPVKPFKAGKILNVVKSRVGLGNHVVVDHGEGLTSVYAHLSSISVAIGQDVDINTTLGFEGSTGVSTGTHLHFEIRLNGQPKDPQQYIASQLSN